MTHQHVPIDIPPPTAADRAADVRPAPTPRRSEATPIRREWVAGVLAVGVLLDLALRRNYVSSLGVSLLLVGAAVAIWFAGVSRGRRTVLLLSGSSIFAVLLTIRSDPRLTEFNLIASVLLLGLGAIGGRIPDLAQYRLAQFIRDLAELIFYSVETVVEAGAEANIRVGAARTGDRMALVLQVVRGLALALPIIVVLTILLASADVVFSNLVSVDSFSIGSWLGHLAIVSLGAYLFAVILRLGLLPTRFAPIPGDAVRLGATEAIVVLFSLVALFMVFTVTQVFTYLGGGSEALAAAGISYTDYARQGFFQLLWVAGITLAVLMVFWVITVRSERSTPILQALNIASVVLILCIVGVAFGRLQLYITGQGLTPLRFYSSVFSIWVGIAFVIVGVRLAGVGVEQTWLMSALVGSGLAVLIVLNAINPDALIVAYNIDRFDHAEPGKIDTISDDGVAALLAELEGFPTDVQELILSEVCDTSAAPGFLDWNLGRSRAESARLASCPE